MKIITVLGSPKKNGNTAKTLGWLEEELKSQGHETERINVVDQNINGCLGCYVCQQNPNEPACAQKDDGNSIYQKIIDADAVVFSCGLYMWSFPSQLKSLLDRGICMVSGYMTPEFKSLVDGKKTALLVTCAGPEENNADLIKSIFQRWSGYAKSNTENLFTVLPGCTVPDEFGEAAREKCKALAASIVV